MGAINVLLGKIHILREHLTSEYRLVRRLDQIDEKLLFIMENLIDITHVKKASGMLRLRQEINLALMRIIDAVARKNQIRCWLNYGTLLGAVRHKGFIPWDDDADMSVLRHDYTRLLDCVRDVGGDFLAVFRGKDEIGGVEMGFSRVVERESHYFVDIYPFDRIPGALDSSSCQTKWEQAYYSFLTVLSSETRKTGVSQNLYSKIEEWLRNHGHGDGDIDGVAPGLESVFANIKDLKIYKDSDIFPLSTGEFEGCTFFMPARPEGVLEKMYGDFYRFPKDVNHATHEVQTLLPATKLRIIVDQLNDLRSWVEKS